MIAAKRDWINGISVLIAPEGQTPDQPLCDLDGRGAESVAVGFHVRGEGPPFVGKSTVGLFYYGYRSSHERLEEILADFLRYESARRRVPILFATTGIDLGSLCRRALQSTPGPSTLRPSDPRWLVHSTCLTAGHEIRRDGAIKSYARLCAEGRRPAWHALRSESLGELPEYADQINLGRTGSPWVEVVPASHAAGEFLSPDSTYTPGWRFYFDAHELIRSGRVIRAVGEFKVEHELPLSGLCVAQIDRQAVDPDGRVSEWTPRQFTAIADQVAVVSADAGAAG
ncbi:MAG: hypothetical protein IT442_16640 [Phycisphaeraceae bacterium]|nr:hypothetical protein [Phycisphaeraceae bacterium]